MSSEKQREYDRKYSAANKERRRVTKSKWRAANPEKQRGYRRKWSVANPEKQRNSVRKSYTDNPGSKLAADRKYKLPAPTRPMPELCERGCGRKAICLDHCHSSNKFRGWLCRQCNCGIGMLGDSIEGLKAGIEYLTRSM